MTRSCLYEPDVNATYHRMAQHYGTAVLPTRPRRPKDKAKVEVGVQIVERWILARLRNRTFFSLAELNAAIAELLESVNTRPLKKLPGSRRQAWERIDRPALPPLPDFPYVYAEWVVVRAGIDYHVEIDSHAYSVPHKLARLSLDVRLTDSTVEIFHKNTRVASHPRARHAGGCTTALAHMPKSHRAHREWTPERVLAWARDVGDWTYETVARMLESKPHPEHGYRACRGVQQLGKRHGLDRLEAACQRTLAINAPTYRSLEAILKQGIDRIPLPSQTQADSVDFVHENVRGADYYREAEAARKEPLC